MILHDPANINLPPIKVEKKNERIDIENDNKVKNLIKTNLLLDKSFNNLYIKMLKNSKNLFEIIEELMKEEISPTFISYYLEDSEERREIFYKFYSLSLFKNRIKSNHKLKNITVKEELLEVKTKMYNEIKKELIKISNNIQEELNKFEVKKKMEIQILTPTNIYTCQKCNKIISTNRFKRFNCKCGIKIKNINQVNQIPLYHFNNALIKFLSNNYWFEHGIDYILKRKNLETLVGYYVLGHSGVWHEIDNIADNIGEKFRFFCECKNSDIKGNDILIFSGKMIDIGCTRGYIFTTSKEITGDLIRLARARNIDIITDVLNKTAENLMKEIKEG